MKKLYCFIGLPCSGKTYAAKLISSKIFNGDCTHISTGDIARSLMSTDKLKNDTIANDRFPLEDLMRKTLVEKIDDAPDHPVLVDGFPRFDDQVNFLIDNLWIHRPVIIQVHVGDPVTLFSRARMRGRETVPEFEARYNSASKNMDGIFKVIHQRLCPNYTINSTSDDVIIAGFKKLLKDKI